LAEAEFYDRAERRRNFHICSTVEFPWNAAANWMTATNCKVCLSLSLQFLLQGFCGCVLFLFMAVSGHRV
jgi:hypothetical protein